MRSLRNRLLKRSSFQIFATNTAFTAAVTAALLITGCSKFMGNLRPDLDDSTAQTGPTQGGTWPEHGFLADDTPENPGAERYSSVGHSERGIASVGSGQEAGNTAWYGQKDADNNTRDSMRGNGDPAFSSNPNLDPPTKRLYRNGNRATRADFVDDSQNEGSLWASDGQTNYYFTKNKIRGVGDIISVKMETGIVKDLSTEIKRTLSSSEKDYELAMAQDRIRAKALGAADPTQTAAAGGAPGAPGAADAGRAPASAASNSAATNAAIDASLPQATTNDIDVSKSIDIKENDLMMAEIVERFPNGNYKIRGTKRVQYKGGSPRLITMMGVARGADIAEDDVIPSGKLYEYRLEALR